MRARPSRAYWFAWKNSICALFPVTDWVTHSQVGESCKSENPLIYKIAREEFGNVRVAPLCQSVSSPASCTNAHFLFAFSRWQAWASGCKPFEVIRPTVRRTCSCILPPPPHLSCKQQTWIAQNQWKSNYENHTRNLGLLVFQISCMGVQKNGVFLSCMGSIKKSSWAHISMSPVLTFTSPEWFLKSDY